MKKFLVCGDVEGNFDALNQKISQLIKKGQHFDFLICIGSTLSLTFNINDYKTSQKRFPIRTYFIDCSELAQCVMQKYPYLEEICPNFFFLGRSGLMQIEGLDICFISGLQSHQHQEFYSENHCFKTSFTGSYFTQNDINLIEQEVKRKGENFKGVDILLSNEWPFGYENNTKIEQSFNNKITEKSLYIAQIADLVCPRYHFAARNGQYLSRAPYLNRKKIMTRFIAFGKISGGGEQKYLSAYQVQPLSQMEDSELKSFTEDTTQNPYSSEVFQNPYKRVEQQEIEEEEDQEEDVLQRKMRLKKQKQNEGWSDDEQQDDQQKVQKQDAPTEELTENVTLFVGHFDPKYTNSDHITDFLARWGKIQALELVYDDKTRKIKGYGYVKYENLKTTQAALQESGAYSLHGQKINFKIKQGEKGATQKYEKDSRGDAVCWFCYNSPDINQKLIFYTGQEVYLAIDIGPITQFHFLILPKEHVKNYTSLSTIAQKEIEGLKQKMSEIMYKQYNKGLICFERYMKLNENKQHMIIHCVPVDLQKTDNFKQRFESGVRAHRLNFFKMKKEEEIEEFVAKTEFYFFLELYGKDKYLYAFKEGVKFHYDFGRQIICEIFSINKVNWKDCVLQEKEIQEDVKELKFQLAK